MTRLALLLAVVAAAVLFFVRSAESAPAAMSEALLGRSPDDAMRALGPPSRVGGDAELQRWHWKDVDGVARTVWSHHGRIVHVDLGGAPLPAEPAPLPADRPYAGQPIDQLLGRLGNPDRVVNHPIPKTPGGREVAHYDTVLVYGDDWITIGGERVLSVGSEPRPFHSGPR